jgi:limonene-1,2-epoxide hydrolase
MITASEARRMAGPTPKERVEAIMPLIEAAAKVKRERQVAIHDDFWVNEGYSQTPDYKEACTILKGLGYEVEFFYQERQFVDMYTIVKW